MSNTKQRKTLRWKLAQWLEIRWWRHYLSDKSPANYLQQKAEYWQRVLDVLGIACTKNQTVLDVGCGPAGIFLILKEQSVDAVDPLLDQYRASIPHFEPARFPWVNFHSAPLENFQLQRSYKYVFCLNAINHVDDWQKGLDQLTLATQNDGQLILGIDVHNHKWLKFVFQNIPGDVLHPHQHDREDYRQALEQHGWKITKEHTWKKGLIFDYWLIVLQKKNDQSE
jgi:2-polyprenyl-6-hydroxyphenyl methylase/3-demethylubiquinone-9 3-methyltransferase